MRLTGIFSLMILLCGFCFSGELISQANDFYDKGDYEGAILKYEEALKDKCPGNPDLYFNLGNSYFRAGKLGKAILNYKRALSINPRDPEAKANLEYVSRLKKDKVIPAKKSFFAGIFSGPARYFSLKELVYLSASLFLSCMVLLSASFFVFPKRIIYYFAAVCFACWLLLTGSLLYRKHCFGQAQAIVMAKESVIRYGPGEDETVKMRIHEGTELFVVEERGKWLYGKLIDGESGWIYAGDVEII
ncbi:MAG: tetratricopeptide repeat protein [Candidatus Aureabacteria bacterium]|nr:tetratricopeptide repeat protein [Candidatus Auribacterota bacterium]